MAHRIITQVVITGARVLGRSLSEAFKQAQASSVYARAQAKTGNGGGGGSGIPGSSGVGGMTLQEACQILNVKPPKGRAADLEEVQSRFKRLFDANDPHKGGSFYLQSKILRARERLEADIKPKMEAAAEETEVKEGWKPGLYKEQPKERPRDI